MTDYRKWDVMKVKEAEEVELAESERQEKLLGYLDGQVLHRLLALAKDKELILFGVAPPGSYDMLETRCEVTKHLIQQGQCVCVAIEEDFPAIALLHAYVTSLIPTLTFEQAFAPLTGFPSWTWNNHVLRDFITWLKSHNDTLPVAQRCGFLGIDLYCLTTASNALIASLTLHDAPLASRVKEHFIAFDRISGQPAVPPLHCMEHTACCTALHQALDSITTAFESQPKCSDVVHTQDAQFIDEGNRRVMEETAGYYTSMFEGKDSNGWELREMHCFDALEHIRQHFLSTRGSHKLVLWAHNNHIGNGKYALNFHHFNLGQLVKETYPLTSLSVGSLCYAGEITAVTGWGEPEQILTLQPGLLGSYEAMMHTLALKAKVPTFCLDLHPIPVQNALNYGGQRQLQRSMGAIYRPEHEVSLHYYPSDISHQYDALVYIDTSRPLTLKPAASLLTKLMKTIA